MLNLESISVSYGKHAVLSGLDLTIKEGVVAGLLGPNGCGKSTLVRSIAGAQHCHGSVSYGKRSGRALQDVTGYMPQEIPGHIALTAMESVLVSAQRGGLRRAREGEVEGAPGRVGGDVQARLDPLRRRIDAAAGHRVVRRGLHDQPPAPFEQGPSGGAPASASAGTDPSRSAPKALSCFT